MGSTKDQQDLCDFLAKHQVDLKSIVDNRIVSFEDAPAAFDYLGSGILWEEHRKHCHQTLRCRRSYEVISL